MKAGTSLASFAVLGLVMSAGAFAKDAQSGKLTLAHAAIVGNTELKPGDYEAEWSGPAKNLQISIVQHG